MTHNRSRTLVIAGLVLMLAVLWIHWKGRW